MKMITDYDCRKAFIKVEKMDYLFELEIAEECFKTSKLISLNKDFKNAYIILYRGFQFIGNAILIKKFNLKSKNKNCQFKYLFEEGILTKKDIVDISDFSEIRNHIYYNNATILADIEEEDYKVKYDTIINLVKRLKEEEL